jgi:1,2-dihydroxy-3-keto-5-methylthiopentene dioxygenase
VCCYKRLSVQLVTKSHKQADGRLPHDSGRAVDLDCLARLGIHYFQLDSVEDVNSLAAERGYKNRDEVTVSPGAMGAAYEDNIKMFFTEHLHEDEEIRYVRDGSGFFDVRGHDDEWVRIRVEKNDLLILPAGIYHRFTTDEGNVRPPLNQDSSTQAIDTL